MDYQENVGVMECQVLPASKEILALDNQDYLVCQE